MTALREYVIHVIATAMLCTVVLRFVHSSGTVTMMLQLLCSIILAYAIIQPVKQIDFPDLGDIVMEYRDDASAAVMQGNKITSDALIECISSGAEAYILEKSKEMNLDFDVEVEVSEDRIPTPVAVTLKGKASPYAKAILSQTISNDLNIPKEQQKWIFQ